MKRVMKTALICVLLLGLCFGLSGCGAREPDYYTAGLEVTKLIGEMIHSRDYCSLFLYSMDQFDSIREAADTNDYDAPVAVYSLTMGSCDDLIRKLGGEEEMAKWDRLSESLKDNVRKRYNVQTIASLLNAQQGAGSTALWSVLTASVENDSLNPEKAVSYLYVFEKGVPVLVTFGYHSAYGIVVSLPEEDRESLSSLRQVFEPYTVEVTRVTPAQ